MKKNLSIKLTESAIMIVLSIVLSFVKVIDLPFGGSITAFSMLPIIIIAYRHGTCWGLFSAFTFGIIQMFLGMNNLSYATSAVAVVAIIALDYLVAFTVLGFGAIFKKHTNNQGTALALGAVFTGILRYICHIISGCTVWAGLSIPSSDALFYSIAYNGTYMIPEIIITAVAAIYISKILSFNDNEIKRAAPAVKKPDLAVLLSGISITSILFAIVWDIKEIALCLQNPATGDFEVTGMLNVNWISVLAVTIACLLIFIALRFIVNKISAENSVSCKGIFTAIPFVAAFAGISFDVWYIAQTFIKATPEKPVEITNWINMILLTIAIITATVIILVRYIKKKSSNKTIS